jgi:tRNA(fMet)-specific endonuclease VapC
VALLIDSSILIEHERGRLDLDGRVLDREDEGFFLSVVTVSELLHGVHRASDPGQRARRSAFVETVLDAFPILGVDLLTARTHAELWSGLARHGQPIGAHDLWIAATCVGRGMRLITANVREFGRVPGLDVEVWAG